MGAARGATRYDTSQATRKYAATPRDAAVGLDHMGARFYSPELALFTSGDPVAITAPERLVTADFAAANPYAYAKQSPVLHADHDGHFWHVAIGALIGGGVEAAHQYLEHGKIESWGRVGAAASGGAVSGALTALNPAAGLAAAMTDGAAIGVISGGTQRLVESGGKSAGTLSDVVLDAAAGAVTAGVAKGVGAIVKKVAPRVVAAVRGLGRAKAPTSPTTAIQPYWPPNRGFMGTPARETLSVGTEIDRFGHEGGTFVAPKGTPFGMRGLPQEAEKGPYTAYRVLKPIEVRSGPAQPAFGQIGTGTQHELPTSVGALVESGHLERVGQ